MTAAAQQSINVSPATGIKVDTGDNWLDFWFVVALMLLATGLIFFLRKAR